MSIDFCKAWCYNQVMITKTVAVTQYVEVTIDETKFDEAFMEEFRDSFYKTFDTTDKHIEHLAQLHARGIVDNLDFIEGYGPAKDMGIKFDIDDTEIEIVD